MYENDLALTIKQLFFHFTQALWRHVQEIELAVKYCKNLNIALNIQKLNS